MLRFLSRVSSFRIVFRYRPERFRIIFLTGDRKVHLQCSAAAQLVLLWTWDVSLAVNFLRTRFFTVNVASSDLGRSGGTLGICVNLLRLARVQCI